MSEAKPRIGVMTNRSRYFKRRSRRAPTNYPRKAEAEQVRAKRSLTAQIQTESKEKPKRMREDAKIHAIFMAPRHFEQAKAKNIPPIAATEAVSSELINV